MKMLIIAEKPSVSQAIAGVLGVRGRRDGYLEGNKALVTWCLGHLVELAQAEAWVSGGSLVVWIRPMF